ncbi:MAG: hypothetical protein OCC49_04285 [Fibrobacterales bacterium]
MNRCLFNLLIVSFIILIITGCSNSDDSSTGITIDTGNVITAEIENADGSIPDSVQLRIVPLDSLNDFSRPVGDVLVAITGEADLEVSLEALSDSDRYFVEFISLGSAASHNSTIEEGDPDWEPAKGLWIRGATKKEISMILQRPIYLTEMQTLQGVVDTEVVQSPKKVRIVHTDIIADVDEDGYYEFTQVPRGSYTLLFLGSSDDEENDWYSLDTVVSVGLSEDVLSSSQVVRGPKNLSSSDEMPSSRSTENEVSQSSSSSNGSMSSSEFNDRESISSSSVGLSSEEVAVSSSQSDGTESGLGIVLSSSEMYSSERVDYSSSSFDGESIGDGEYSSAVGHSSSESIDFTDSLDLSHVLPRGTYIGPWRNPYGEFEQDPYPESLYIGVNTQFLLQLDQNGEPWLKLYGKWSQIGNTIHVLYSECHHIISSIPLNEEIVNCPDWINDYNRFLWKDGKLFLVSGMTLQQWVFIE